jgi:hypothetical protein
MMKRFIEGADRNQSTLLPECLDDWVDERMVSTMRKLAFPDFILA